MRREMTAGDFLDELRKTPRAWRFEDGALRCWVGGLCYCPITMVALRVTEEECPIEYACFAGEGLGLSEVAIDNIMMAADTTWGSDARLRAQLVEACGLIGVAV